MSKDKKYISCDGEGCQANALAPVALRSLLQEDPNAPNSTTGWLFIHNDGHTCHFCPRCTPHYLNALSSSKHKPGDSQ